MKWYVKGRVNSALLLYTGGFNMIKLRITFDKEHPEEVEEALEKIKENFDIISESRVYPGRGNSRYSNIYLDVENK